MSGKKASPPANEAGKGKEAGFVFVALNHPHGILFKMPANRELVIEGNAAKLRGAEKGVLPVGAFGLTKVAAEDWEYIKKTYAQMRIFQSGLIFAQDHKDKAVDQAEERTEMRHGREPVDTATTATTESKPEV